MTRTQLLVPTRRGRWWKVLLAAAIVFVAIFAAMNIAARRMVPTMVATGPNGPETPASVGVPFERVSIPSGPRQLDSYVVTAGATCANPPVVLIHPGLQETISEWVKAQKLLFDHCVSSVVFNYTGVGNSSHPERARFENFAEDCVAAYEFTRRRFPNSPVYVLGHSLGNATMLSAAPRYSVPPAGVIVASPFASLRSIAQTRNTPTFYRVMAYAMPDWWNNVRAVRQIHSPLLVIHSDSDQKNPFAGGQEVFYAAPQPKSFVTLHGYDHNAIYQHPEEQWWSPILRFVNAPAPPPVTSSR